jgi:hypothetical protein
MKFRQRSPVYWNSQNLHLGKPMKASQSLVLGVIDYEAQHAMYITVETGRGSRKM